MAANSEALVKSFSFDSLERGWLKQSIENQKRVLQRSRQKEIVGGEVWTLRGKEIDYLQALLVKLG